MWSWMVGMPDGVSLASALEGLRTTAAEGPNPEPVGEIEPVADPEPAEPAEEGQTSESGGEYSAGMT
jgi:hypothetical protein